MKPVHYVILNPSGNLTALVTDHGGPEDEKEIVTSLMRESEQVAFLEPPMEPGALARAIETGDRLDLGVTAPAHGLTLMDVFYALPDTCRIPVPPKEAHP